MATATLAVLCVLALVGLGYLLRKPIAWLLIAGFLALALAPLVDLLSRHVRRGGAIALAYLTLVIVPVLVALVLIPPIVRGATGLVDDLPGYAQEAQAYVQDHAWLRGLDEKYDLGDTLRTKADGLPAHVADAAKLLGNAGLGAVNSVFAGVTIVIFSLFLLTSGPRWRDVLLRRIPTRHAAAVEASTGRMAVVVGAYIGGALGQALVAGAASFVVLLLLGVPSPLALATLVALFDLIPMVGATLAAIVIGLVTLFHGFPVVTIIWVVWSVVYQQIENNVIQPRIQQRALGVHPLGVMFAVLCGGTLLGVAGALLAVPVAAMMQIAVADWLAWRDAPAKALESAAAG